MPHSLREEARAKSCLTALISLALSPPDLLTLVEDLLEATPTPDRVTAPVRVALETVVAHRALPLVLLRLMAGNVVASLHACIAPGVYSLALPEGVNVGVRQHVERVLGADTLASAPAAARFVITHVLGGEQKPSLPPVFTYEQCRHTLLAFYDLAPWAFGMCLGPQPHTDCAGVPGGSVGDPDEEEEQTRLAEPAPKRLCPEAAPPQADGDDFAL